MGAAVATVIGQVTHRGAGRMVSLSHEGSDPAQAEFGLHNGRLMKRFLPLGIAAFVPDLLVASMAAINNMIRTYGALDPVFSQPVYAQIPMAVVGIVMKFFQIVISISWAWPQGAFPLWAIIWVPGAGPGQKPVHPLAGLKPQWAQRHWGSWNSFPAGSLPCSAHPMRAYIIRSLR